MSTLNVSHLNGKVVVFRSLRSGTHGGDKNSERYFYATSDVETSGGYKFNRIKQKYKKGYKKELDKGVSVGDRDIHDAYKWIIRVIPGTQKFYLENYLYKKKFLTAQNAVEFDRTKMEAKTINNFNHRTGKPNVPQSTFFFIGPGQTNSKYLNNVMLTFKRSSTTDKTVCQINNHSPRSLRGKMASLITPGNGNPSDYALYKACGSSVKFKVYILGAAPRARL